MADCHPDRKHRGKGLCNSCYVLAWMKAHPEADTGNTWLRNRPERRRELGRRGHLKATYGITPDEYAAMWEQQQGLCANPGCRTFYPPDGDDYRKALHVDHNHETGQIRGLLCPGCNIALGMAGENAERLLGLIEYLRICEN